MLGILLRMILVFMEIRKHTHTHYATPDSRSMTRAGSQRSASASDADEQRTPPLSLNGEAFPKA